MNKAGRRSFPAVLIVFPIRHPRFHGSQSSFRPSGQLQWLEITRRNCLDWYLIGSFRAGFQLSGTFPHAAWLYTTNCSVGTFARATCPLIPRS